MNGSSRATWGVVAGAVIACAGCGPLNAGLRQGLFGGSYGKGNASAVGETEEQAKPNPGGQGLSPADISVIQRAGGGGVLFAGTMGEQHAAVSLARAAEKLPIECPVPDLKSPETATQQEIYEHSVKMLAAGCDDQMIHYAPNDYRAVLWDQPGYTPTQDELYAALYSVPDEYFGLYSDLGKLFDPNAYARAALDDSSFDARRQLNRLSGAVRVRARLHSEKEPAKQHLKAEELRKEWREKFYEPHKAELDPALAYIFAATKPRRVEGKIDPPPCTSELRKTFVAYVTSQKPKSTAEVEQISRDPVGSVLLYASYLCDVARKDTLSATAEIMYIGQYPLLGARTYALRRTDDFYRPDSLRNQAVALWTGSTIDTWDTPPDHTPHWGVIDKVEDQGDKVLVKFKIVSLGKEYFTDNCWSTNRIESIDNYGRIVYEQQCSGHLEEVKGAEPPILVAKALAAGLAPGRYFVFRLNYAWEFKTTDEGPRPAVPIHVDDKKIPVAAFGIPIEGGAPPKPKK